jgi:hypothetical protein
MLGTEIMKALYYRHPIHLDDLLRKARTSFVLQADFARRHRIREPGMSPAKAGAAFAAWHAIEYVEPRRICAQLDSCFYAGALAVRCTLNE